MSSNYKQEGDVIQYTAAADIPAGKVIKIGNILGVALVAIPNGSTGAVATKGVFTVPKVTTAVIAQGDALLWDVSALSGAGAFDAKSAPPAAGDIGGAAAYAFAAAGNGATTLQVKFTGVPGTLT